MSSLDWVLELPGAEQYVMVHHPAYRVGKKPFLILGMERDDETLSVNLGRMEQGELLRDPRFQRTSYIGQHGWVTFKPGDFPGQELRELIEDSWRRVARKRDLKDH